MADIGLLIIRLVIGLTIFGHGAQKVFAWFGGGGPEKTGASFDSMGLKPGKTIAVLSGWAEVIGGLLFAAGLLTFVGAILIIITMIGAIFTVHFKNGFWANSGGYEYNLTIIAASLGVALVGAGGYSIDTLIL